MLIRDVMHYLYNFFSVYYLNVMYVGPSDVCAGLAASRMDVRKRTCSKFR